MIVRQYDKTRITLSTGITDNNIVYDKIKKKITRFKAEKCLIVFIIVDVQ